MKLSSKDRIKQSWKKTFSKSNSSPNTPQGIPELTFPTSLSPVSTLGDLSPFRPEVNKASAPSSWVYSPASTISSSSSYVGNDNQSSYFLEMITRDKGPRIKPYIYTQTQPQRHGLNSPRSLSNARTFRCFICDELVQTKLANENIVELECGDSIHEQCLTIQVDHQVDKLLLSNKFTVDREKLLLLILPKCAGECCDGDGGTICCVDKDYTDSLLCNAISKSIEFDKRQMQKNKLLGSPIRMSQPRFSSFVEQDLRSVPRNLRPVSRPLFDLPIELNCGDTLKSHNSFSTIRSPSPVPTVSTTNNDTIKMTEHESIALDELRNTLLQQLIANCSSFNLSTLIKLGELRLADSLLVKFAENTEWVQKTVYLFDKYLLILKSEKEYELYELNNSSFSIELDCIKIFSDFDRTIWLNSDKSSILEKWVVSLSDFSFVFPLVILTSTLNTTEVAKRMSDSTINMVPFDPFESIVIRSAEATTTPQSGRSSMYLDSDHEVIAQIMNTLNQVGVKLPINSDSDTDSDYDSDQDMIKGYLDKVGVQ